MMKPSVQLPTDNPLQPIYALPILIVDDNEINRLFIEKALRAHGFTKLFSVESAREALEKLDLFQPDIVILDIIMPGMNGFDCCKAIREHPKYHDLPILIQTTITEPALRVQAFENGATDFISKPLYAEELCARVVVHLEKRLSLKILQLYKDRIETEMESARQLQQAILPEAAEIEDIERRCHLTIAHYFQPSSEIGGDFWGMKNIFPHQTAFWLVDFSGHGVASALNAFRLQAYIKEHSALTARPGEYVSYLNDKLLHLLLRGQFATMFYGIIDTQMNQLFYTCACTPHPMLLRRSTGKAHIINGRGNPLGIGMHLYQTQSTTFASGDILLLYSDALIETPNAAGHYITEKDIMALLEKHSGATAADIKIALLNYFRQHAGSALPDDLTIVICSRSPY